MTKVSVIVPVYNVEKYLDKCLYSLACQTLKDIEVIVVNDESPDNSQKIIEKYEKKYSHIHGYKKKNGGVSDARNFGLSKATGDYIAFLDGDDYVTYNAYELMYKKAVSGNFDVVACNLNYIYDQNKTIEVSSKINKDTTNIKNTYVNMYPSVCNKIFKKKLFNQGIKFKLGVWYEDVDLLYKLMPYVKTIGTVNKPLIQYVQHAGSITKTFDKRLYNYVDNFNALIEFYKERNLLPKFSKELEYIYVRYLLATFVKQATNYNKEEYNKAVKTAIHNVKKHFPHYRRNKYFYKSIKGIYLLCFNRAMANILYVFQNRKGK